MMPQNAMPNLIDRCTTGNTHSKLLEVLKGKKTRLEHERAEIRQASTIQDETVWLKELDALYAAVMISDYGNINRDNELHSAIEVSASSWSGLVDSLNPC